MSKTHAFKFFRAGGFDQVRLDTGADILAIGELDQKLWVALSCPVGGLEFDKRTLELIDADKDGRIRAPEVIAAVTWMGEVLKDPDDLLEGEGEVALSAIDTQNEEGKRLHASAKQILKNLGKKEQKSITLDDTLDTAKIFAQTKFNGDGIVPVASAEEPEIAKAIEEIIATAGGETDRSGAPGVSQAKVDAFFADAKALDEWWKAAEADLANVMPMGDATVAAAASYRAVKAKVDDYFARTRLVAFDPRAAGPLNRDEAEYVALATKELTAGAPDVASFPLARVEADKPLPLERGLNPAWSDAIKKLRAEVIKPLIGERAALTEADWASVAGKLAAHEAWAGKKPATMVESLGLPRLRELLAGEAKAKVDALIAKDKALEPEANAISSVEKLVRYHRDLYKLLVNFVSFRDFYAKKDKAIFQAGTLYLDGRSCELCVKVGDPAAHATLGSLSNACLVYCECKRKGAEEKMFIVAALTGGDSDNIMVSRNGVFYDREGNDWDATIVKIVENPISVRQAFWTPYKRVAKLINDQIEKFAASRDKEVEAQAGKGVEESAKDVTAAPAAAAAPEPAKEEPPFDVAKFAGIFAAIGLAIGGIATMFGAVASGFLSLHLWQMPFAIAGLLLLISGPSMLLAWLKLRQRNIGPILDAAGWAVNARARLNVPFGGSLTGVAALPEGAERSMDDPYADKGYGWVFWVFLLVVAAAIAGAWKLGYVQPLLNDLSAAPSASAAPSSSAYAAPAK